MDATLENSEVVKPDEAETTKFHLNEPITRREFIKRTGRLATGIIAGTIIGNLPRVLHPLEGDPAKSQAINSSSIDINAIEQTPIAENIPKFSREIKLNPAEINSLNAILNLDLLSESRLQKEREYAQNATTLNQIDGGLLAIVDLNVRNELLNKRYEIRQSGKEADLEILSPEMEQWAKENNIDPETLGICIDALRHLSQIKKSLWEKARDIFKGGFIKLPYANGLPKNLLPIIAANNMALNPGAIAKLMMTETSGFRYIGEVPAIDQINEEVFPQAKGALGYICNLLKPLGLFFNEKRIPGSKRGDPEKNISGGAISAQFIPDRIKAINDFLTKQLNIILNPFDPTSATVMVYIFLSINEGLENWNPDEKQIGEVLAAGKSYQKMLKF